jgi:hypothetical protein
MDEAEKAIQATKQWGLQTIMHVYGANMRSDSPDAMEQVEICRIRADGVIKSILAEVVPLANQSGSLAASMKLFVRRVLNWVADNYQKS